MERVNNKPEAVYANFVGVSSSAYEVRVEFGIETPDQEDRLKQIADIRMSPQLAKQFRDILNQAVTSYETNFGELPTIK